MGNQSSKHSRTVIIDYSVSDNEIKNRNVIIRSVKELVVKMRQVVRSIDPLQILVTKHMSLHILTPRLKQMLIGMWEKLFYKFMMIVAS
jgi:hypothetical protein